MAKKKKDKITVPVIEPEIGDALVERAKSAGFSSEQIATYSDPAQLEAACNRVKPQMNVDTAVKQRPVVAYQEPEGKPVQAKLTTEITLARSQNVKRCDYDNMIMQSFIRREKITGITKITIEQNCVPSKKDLLTSTITIDYRKKG